MSFAILFLALVTQSITLLLMIRDMRWYLLTLGVSVILQIFVLYMLSDRLVRSSLLLFIFGVTVIVSLLLLVGGLTKWFWGYQISLIDILLVVYTITGIIGTMTYLFLESDIYLTKTSIW